jgi:hypothetical protein
MTQAELHAVGFRWTKPTWERTADASMILIVPSTMLKDADLTRKTDTDARSSERMYEIYEFDGNWFDQLHERQVERLLHSPRWRDELRPERRSA